jgi:RND family efflux transporter MFP subunit
MINTIPSARIRLGMNRRLRALGCGVSAALLVMGCGLKEHKPRVGEYDRLPRVEVMQPVERPDFERHIELSATVEPMEQTVLSARVPGYIDFLPPEIDIGKAVKKGEKLVGIAVPDLEAQKKLREALLEQARKQKVQAQEARKVGDKELLEAEKQELRYAADFKLYKASYERIYELARQKATQPERVEEAERQRDSAQAAWDASKALIETRKTKLKLLDADIEAAEARILVAEAEVANLAVMINFATIRAPYDAIITKRWVDRGALTFVTTSQDAGVRLLTIQRSDAVRVLVDIPERDVPFIKDNQVTFRIPALADKVPGGEFQGRVALMAGSLDPNTRTMRTEIHLPNPGRHLKPGMYGKANVSLETRYKVLTLPSTALVRRGDKIEVAYVADNPAGSPSPPDSGVVQRVEVELGLDDGQTVEIKKGLTKDMRVLVKGSGVLHRGDHVRYVWTKN